MASDSSLNLFNADSQIQIINNIVTANKEAQVQDVQNLNSILATKAPIDNPTFTGIVSGINKSMVGLSNVNNTSDADKQISDQTQIALSNKQDKTSFNSPLSYDGINKTLSIPNYTIDLSNKQDKFLTYTGSITYDTTTKNLHVDSYNKSETDIALSNKQDKIITFSSPLNYDAISKTLSVPNYTIDLNNKQDKFLTYTGSITYNTVTKNLNVDSYGKSESDTLLSNKQDKITTFASPLNYDAISKTLSVPNYTIDLNNKQDKFLTYTGAVTYNMINKELKVDAYSRSEIDQKFVDLVGVGTLTTLDTLKEIGNAIGNDPNLATTLNNAIANKQDKILIFDSPLNYDALSKTLSIPNYSTNLNNKQDKFTVSSPLSLSNNLLSIPNYQLELNNKQDKFQIYTGAISYNPSNFELKVDAYNKTTTDSALLTKQDRLTTSLPLSLANNNLSIDLNAYATVLNLNNKQDKFTVSSPLSLSNNNLSIDLSSKQNALLFPVSEGSTSGWLPINKNTNSLRRLSGNSPINVLVNLDLTNPETDDLIISLDMNLSGLNNYYNKTAIERTYKIIE